MFHPRYAHDYNNICLEVCCTLLYLEYNNPSPREVSKFYGKIRGVNVTDAIVIDFYDGVAARVVGSLHSCVYQLEFIGTSKSQHNRTQDNENLGESVSEIYSNPVPIILTFEMYCNLQEKSYVESLLEYLLQELKRSQEKTELNLNVMNELMGPLHLENVKITESVNIMEVNNASNIGNGLENSIRYQMSEGGQSQIIKDRLEIIKQYQKQNREEEEEEEEFFSDRSENSIDFIEEESEPENSPPFNGKNVYDSPLKQEKDQEFVENSYNEDDCIILTPESEEERSEEVYVKSPKISLKKGIKKQKHGIFDQEKKVDNQKKEKIVQSQSLKEDEIQHLNPMKERKRKKIFTQCSNPVPKPNLNSEQKSDLDSPVYPTGNEKGNKGFMKNNLSNKNGNESFSSFQINRESIIPDREIPTSVPHPHPNSMSPQKKTLTIPEFEVLLHENSIEIYQKWRKFIAMLAEPIDSQTKNLIKIYLKEYTSKLNTLLNESVVRFQGSWDIDIYSKEQNLREKMAKQMRLRAREDENTSANEFKFYDIHLWSQNKTILFEEKTTSGNSSGNFAISKDKKISLSHNNNPKHIVFLVHGLGACRLDMEKLKNEIKRYHQENYILIASSSNEGRTEGDIDMMGVRLANEVDQEISRRINKEKYGIKISFIGHSMGGIIIRSALPRLEKYKNFFESYVSLSSPHIGYNYSSSKLVDVGLWLINNWKKCQSILQLSMSDTQENKRFSIESTFLYKLSMEKGFEWFKKVTFVASRQDHYVPYFSARVQKHDECIEDLKDNNQYAVTHSKMVDNILSRIVGTVNRVDVNFSIVEQEIFNYFRNIDNFIGRAAHICFLTHTDFLRLVSVVDINGWL